LAWIPLVSGDGIGATWAPDGQHLFTEIGYQLHIFARDGASVASASGRQAVWLSPDVFQVYDSLPATSFDSDGLGQFYTVPGRSIDVSNGTTESLILPCCYPMSNGHGAVAVTRYLTHGDNDPMRPRFVIWQDGTESIEREGLPIRWSAAGDELLVMHPTQGAFDPWGWLEVLSWPDERTLFASDPGKAIGDDPADMRFDSTGRYLAYPYVHQDASQAWQMDIEVADLDAGSVATIPVAGDSSKVGGGYVWNRDSQIMTISESDLKVTTYEPSGEQVKQMTVPQPIALLSSDNGGTILRFVNNKNDDPSDIRILRGATWAPVLVPDGEITNVMLSPGGDQLLVPIGIHGYAPQTAFLADIQSP